MAKKKPTPPDQPDLLTLFAAPRLTGKFVRYSFLSEFHKKQMAGDAEKVFESLLAGGVVLKVGGQREILFYQLKNQEK